MIELILTCVIGSLVGGSVIGAWMWRAVSSPRLAPVRRES
jgi:hypothetical protein